MNNIAKTQISVIIQVQANFVIKLKNKLTQREQKIVTLSVEMIKKY
jgi:hypothetical protein